MKRLQPLLCSFCFEFNDHFVVNSKYSVPTASAEKQRIAEEVASILKLSVDITASERLFLTLIVHNFHTSLEEYCLILTLSPLSAQKR